MLVSKVGPEGHDRDAAAIAYGLRDVGFEVVFLGVDHPAGIRQPSRLRVSQGCGRHLNASRACRAAAQPRPPPLPKGYPRIRAALGELARARALRHKARRLATKRARQAYGPFRRIPSWGRSQPACP